MRVKVILRNPAKNGMRQFEYVEQAIFDDPEAGCAVLLCGKVSGGRIGDTAYHFKDGSHIVYNWSDIEKLEVTP